MCALQRPKIQDMVPFEAYKHFGDSFEWMFVGEDDTVFFPAAAQRVIAGLDPQQPHFLTGKLALQHCLGRIALRLMCLTRGGAILAVSSVHYELTGSSLNLCAVCYASALMEWFKVFV